MAITLRKALSETLQDWQSDLPATWQQWLGTVELGFDKVDEQLQLEAWEPIFPVRKNRKLPGMPANAHMLRCFDGIAPKQVRCVVLGQDPYPAIEVATGRAFEAGNIAQWRELDKMFTKSIRAWVQLVAHARTGNAAYAGSFANWPSTLHALESGELTLESFDPLSQRWENSGALLLNCALTLSRFEVACDPHQTNGHLTLWQPLIDRVIQGLLESDRPLVFLAFGDVAIAALERMGVRAGMTGKVACIARPHPAQAEELLTQDNPLLLCNQHLANHGAAPINW